MILRKQEVLEFHEGLIDDPRVAELIIECSFEK
jgi:hypothetical protein